MTSSTDGTAVPADVTEFEAFAAAAVEEILLHQPVLASSLGDHRFDDRLDDLRPAALEGERRALAGRLAALRRFDAVDLPVAHRVDAEVLGVRLRERLLEIDETGEHSWNPLVANPGNALYLLLARDYAPLPDRLRALAGRLNQVPEQLTAARQALGRMPRVHVETAIDQFTGTLGMLDGEIPAALETEPSMRGLVEGPLEAAHDAVQAHLGWLREHLDAADGDPRLGRERFAAKLALVLDAPFSPDEVLRAALADVEAVEAEIAEVAGSLGGTAREVLDQLATQAPTDDTVVRVARDAIAETTAFVVQHDLVTIFDDPVEVIVMPEIHRGVAIAYCDPPGPLDPPGAVTFFAISPTPAHWSPERVASFYREYNEYALRNLVIHEAMPGHVLQLAHGRRGPASTRVRQAFWNGPFVEGWAVYAEAEMVRHGFGGPQVRIQQLKMRLRTALNAVLDVRVHCDELSQHEAMELMLGRGYQEEGEASGKWRRALLTSTQLSTYHVGATQVDDVVRRLRAARPDWSHRQIHDAVLSHGNPPPRHLPALLGLRP